VPSAPPTTFLRSVWRIEQGFPMLRKQSSNLAKRTLKLFLIDHGPYLDGLTKDGCEQAFRDAFENQIKTLIGKAPRLKKEDNDKYIIFYD